MLSDLHNKIVKLEEKQEPYQLNKSLIKLLFYATTDKSLLENKSQLNFEQDEKIQQVKKYVFINIRASAIRFIFAKFAK